MVNSFQAAGIPVLQVQYRCPVEHQRASMRKTAANALYCHQRTAIAPFLSSFVHNKISCLSFKKE